MFLWSLPSPQKNLIVMPSIQGYVALAYCEDWALEIVAKLVWNLPSWKT